MANILLNKFNVYFQNHLKVTFAETDSGGPAQSLEHTKKAARHAKWWFAYFDFVTSLSKTVVEIGHNVAKSPEMVRQLKVRSAENTSGQ